MAYMHSCSKDAFYRAHQKNLNEDRPMGGGVMVSTLSSINIVNRRWARLLLEVMT